ncbi:Integral membrane protein [Pleurostoma richardsiae]|uniref:Integral membrane protein n=1 Tax=Pleurostoma richardsiae TaxID=41990 RepID=A0AA38VC74_9PEZI|nr:Integral membrane protein [Pleurostoma richardsiae]
MSSETGAASGTAITTRASSTTTTTTTSATGPFATNYFFKLPHDNYGPQLNFTIWLLTALSALFLGLRVYCKFFRHRGLWWDDYVLIASWVTLAAGVSLQSVCVSYGFGKHIWDIDHTKILPFLVVSTIAGFLLILSAVWSKTSFAITLLRISDGWIKRFVWFVIITINIALGVSALFQFIQCWPVEKQWYPHVKGTCWPKRFLVRYNIFTAAYSGAMDVVLATLPWRIIWPLTMNKKEKCGVILAMSMGVFAGITSIIKTVTLTAIGDPDIIRTINLVILATAECAITIMAASIPILRALIRDNTHPPPAQFYHYDENRWAASRHSQARASLGAEDRSQQQQRRKSRLSGLLGERLSERLGGFLRPSGGSAHSRGGSTASSAEPPLGKVVQTDEARIEYHIREIQKIGTGLGPM